MLMAMTMTTAAATTTTTTTTTKTTTMTTTAKIWAAEDTGILLEDTEILDPLPAMNKYNTGYRGHGFFLHCVEQDRRGHNGRD